MTVTLDELQLQYSARQLDIIRHQLLAPSITNRDYEGDARQGQKVRVWTWQGDLDRFGAPTSSPAASNTRPATPTVQTLAANANAEASFANTTANKPAGSYTDIDVDRYFSERWFGAFLTDFYRPGTQEHINRFLGSRIAYTFDQDVLAQMWSQATGDTAATILNSAATSYITNTAEAPTDADDDAYPGKLVFDAIEAFADYCDLTGFGIDAAGVNRVKFFVIDSPTWRAVRKYLRAQNLADEMNVELTRTRTLFAPGMRDRVVANIGGVAIIVQNVLATVNGGSGETNDGKAQRRYIAGTSAAFTVAVADNTTVIWPRGRNPLGDGSANSRADGTLVEAIVYYGLKLVDARQIRTYVMRAEA